MRESKESKEKIKKLDRKIRRPKPNGGILKNWEEEIKKRANGEIDEGDESSRDQVTSLS